MKSNSFVNKLITFYELNGMKFYQVTFINQLTLLAMETFIYKTAFQSSFPIIHKVDNIDI